VIAWKAIQTYRDGAVVRWIGSAESEHPAATTIVSSAIPRERAGGRGAGDQGRAAAVVSSRRRSA
jgi:hypothetical protein